MPELKPGNESSEYGFAKWVTIICGVLGTAMTTILGALAASGALEQQSTLAVVLGAVATVLMTIGGVATKAYIDTRGKVKAANELAKKLDQGNG